MACHFSEPVLDVKHEDGKEVCCNYTLPEKFSFAREPTKENPALYPALDRSITAYKRVLESTSNTIECVSASADEDQRKNTRHLEERAKEVANWRGEIEALVSKLREETVLLDDLRKRMERALTALQTPEVIVNECVARRFCRSGHDMIPDNVDAALAEGQRLCMEIRKTYNLYKAEIESQLQTNKVCKVQLEFDWSDKNEAYRLETINVSLKWNGPISFYPGATRLQANQSTPEHWMHYTKEQVRQGCLVLNQSVALRKRTEEALTQASDDLRSLADSVQLALHRNIAETERSLQEAEEALCSNLSQITIAETLHGKLAHTMRQVDLNLKLSQTRLNNRALRPHAENTRDPIQHNLISEVTHLNDDATRLKQQMELADATLQSLYNSRALLEDKIGVKRKSLYIDRDRCLVHCVKFPDSTSLSGF